MANLSFIHRRSSLHFPRQTRPRFGFDLRAIDAKSAMPTPISSSSSTMDSNIEGPPAGGFSVGWRIFREQLLPWPAEALNRTECR
jgi:hypothetical protein